MTTEQTIQLLEQYRAGTLSREAALQTLQAAPLADLGFAQVDTHRALRKGFPEVVVGSGKTVDQVVQIAGQLVKREQHVLVTRVTPEQARALRRKFKRAVHHELAHCV
ncbi:MAG: 1-(5-phosphoribosyl)-5-amino-4-imidazole-carboxylate carboxylase, partial [Pedosphaera parvula]|nr:1-(5-phosphoribosyl)-5-amino-4-imidazole-carboxylate carboxylase [Pedosphaera parvula]